jgi:tripartite ATP-independent transporter DctM subunit
MEYLPAWMFLALTILLMAGFPVTFTLMGTAMCFGLIGFGWSFFQPAAPAHLGGDDQCHPDRRAPVRLHGGHAGALRPGRGAAGHHGTALRPPARRSGHFRGGGGRPAGGFHRHRGRHGGHHGAAGGAHHARRGYQKELATGTVSASGTLGQIIPPSIVLVLIGDIVGVSVGDLFMGAVLPGLLLVGLFTLYILIISWLRPKWAPAIPKAELDAISPRQLTARVCKALFPPLFLMVAVLGSIFAGIASPTEAAAVGAVGATLLTLANRKFSMKILQEVMQTTVRLTCMVFIILCGAALFGLVFRGLGGDGLVRDFLGSLADKYSHNMVLAIVMGLIFVIGFFLDFIEITFIHVPVLAPIMIEFGYDPVWFCILIAVNLQTSFMTPPFGFSLFYLKAVTPPEISTGHIYRGIIPFVIVQIIGLSIVVLFPQLATWLPKVVFGQ